MCLGYMIDLRQSMYRLPYLFTLSPSNPLILGVQTDGHYTLFINGERVSLSTDIFLLPNIGQTPWTKICLNIDLEKNVVQMFSGRQASVRKLLPISVRCSSLCLFSTLVPGAAFSSHGTCPAGSLLSLSSAFLAGPACHRILGFRRPGDGCPAVGLSSVL